MADPRHLVYVAPGFPGSTQPGGVGTYVALIGAALAAQGHRVSVIALNQRGRARMERQAGMTVYRPVARRALHWYVSKLPRLGRLALALRYLEEGAVVAATLQRV